MRPRPLSAMPWSLAHARMSALRARLAAIRPSRCRTFVPALRVVDVGGELPAEGGGICCAQVDLVAGAVDSEPDRLIRWAAVEVVF